MDSIIVSSKEDMDQIMLWVCKYLSKLPDQDEKIRFDCPFQKGEVLFPSPCHSGHIPGRGGVLQKRRRNGKFRGPPLSLPE